MIKWLTVFFDIPEADFDAAAVFWRTVTGSTTSAPRGDDGEFATLLPMTGDAYLRVQRTRDASPRVHLDLHVDDVSGAARRALELGARELHREQHVVLASPAGFVFCFVEHLGEAEVPAPHALGDGPPHRINQLLIDVPSSSFDAEVSFWSALTGWDAPPIDAQLEYRIFRTERDLPIRLGLQRREESQSTDSAQGHIDIGCGAPVEQAVAAHLNVGGRLAGPHADWMVMRDPAGLPYCLDTSAP